MNNRIQDNNEHNPEADKDNTNPRHPAPLQTDTAKTPRRNTTVNMFLQGTEHYKPLSNMIQQPMTKLKTMTEDKTEDLFHKP